MSRPFLLAFELLCHSNEDVSHHKLIQVIVPELLCLFQHIPALLKVRPPADDVLFVVSAALPRRREKGSHE